MKGQVTIFVIIGLAAIAILSAAIILINQDKIDILQNSVEKDYSKKVQPVKDYAVSCLDKVAIEAFSKFGKQGLLYPNIYLATDDRKIAYFYFKGKSYFPTKEMIEAQFSEYIKENIRDCLKDFSGTGFIVEDRGEVIDMHTIIDDRKISIDMAYPINVYLDTKTIPLDKFTTEIETNFNEIYLLSENIYGETKKNPDWINLEFIQDSEFQIRLIKVDANTIIYEITDEKGLDNKPFKYSFGVKYGSEQ